MKLVTPFSDKDTKVETKGLGGSFQTVVESMDGLNVVFAEFAVSERQAVLVHNATVARVKSGELGNFKTVQVDDGA